MVLVYRCLCVVLFPVCPEMLCPPGTWTADFCTYCTVSRSSQTGYSTRPKPDWGVSHELPLKLSGMLSSATRSVSLALSLPVRLPACRPGDIILT